MGHPLNQRVKPSVIRSVQFGLGCLSGNALTSRSISVEDLPDKIDLCPHLQEIVLIGDGCKRAQPIVSALILGRRPSAL